MPACGTDDNPGARTPLAFTMPEQTLKFLFLSVWPYACIITLMSCKWFDVANEADLTIRQSGYPRSNISARYASIVICDYVERRGGTIEISIKAVPLIVSAVDRETAVTVPVYGLPPCTHQRVPGERRRFGLRFLILIPNSFPVNSFQSSHSLRHTSRMRSMRKHITLASSPTEPVLIPEAHCGVSPCGTTGCRPEPYRAGRAARRSA